jgi:hypothetical protein
LSFVTPSDREEVSSFASFGRVEILLFFFTPNSIKTGVQSQNSMEAGH